MFDTKPITYTQIPLFEGISTENLNELLHCLHNFVREYKKGEVFAVQKMNNSQFFLWRLATARFCF